jgi:hypothetical protein
MSKRNVMKNRLWVYLCLLIPVCISCTGYSSIEKEVLDKVTMSILEEQKTISANIKLKRRNILETVLDNGNKPADKAVHNQCEALSTPVELVLKQIDSLIQKEPIDKRQLSLLEDSLKSLEKKINSIESEGSPEIHKNILPKIRLYFFPSIAEENNTNIKVKLLTLKNMLLLWQYSEIDIANASIGTACLRFQIVFILAKAVSEIVEEGDQYKAELFLASSANIPLNVKLNDSLLTRNPLGMYAISFPTTADTFDSKGLCKKTFELKYGYYNRYKMEDTTCYLKTDYFIRKKCR